MAIFGIGRNNKTATLGKFSQQSVGLPTVSTATRPETVIGAGSEAVGGSVGGLVTARTLTPSLSTIATIASGFRLPGTIEIIKPLLIPPRKNYEQDILNLSQFAVDPSSNFTSIEKDGISVYRPEILSMLSFQPVDGPGGLDADQSSGGSPSLLIKTNYQATELRAQTLQKLITDIRARTEYRIPLDAVKNLFLSKLNSTDVALRYFASIMDKVDVVKVSLDPKKIATSSYDTDKFLSLIDFYDRKMQFSKNKFVGFSDTKILNQLTSDLRNILEGYSFSLLDTVDTDRTNDFSPTKIDKTYTQNDGFTFSVSSLRSQTSETIAAYKPAFFNQFMNSLPSSPDDKIKLLVNLLSKEFRVSKQLGKSEVAQTLRASYNQGDTSNPFDNICGNVGETIFDVPQGTNSLASLTFVLGPNGELVLPFESLYVDSEEDNVRKTYIPGSSYFGDNILNVTQAGYNIKPFVDFSTSFNERLSLASSTIKTLLDGETSPISPENVYDLFSLSLLQATAGLTIANSADKSQSVVLALFKLASTSPELKNLLFEYLLLLGLVSNSSEDRKVFFERLGYEIKTIQNFTYAPITKFDNPSLFEGINSLRPYIENVSKKIEDKVNQLLTPFDIRAFSKNVTTITPSFGGLTLSRNTTTAFGAIRTSLNTGVQHSQLLLDGDLKEILINSTTSVGGSSTNICKEFVDICVKLDQLSSIAGTSNYILPDTTGRSRFNFISTSTQALLAFEILSSLVNKYTFCSFSKKSSSEKIAITINVRETSVVAETIKEIIVSKKVDTLPSFLVSNLGLLPTESARSTEASSYVLRPSLPSAGVLFGNGSTSNSGLGLGLLQVARENLQVGISEEVRRALVGSPTRTTLLNNREKLKEETKTVFNILHIFDIINKKLTTAKETTAGAFSLAPLQSFLTSTGLTIDDLSLIKNPSQLRTSSWLYDRYDERLSDTSLFDAGDVGLGFLATDRVSRVEMNTLGTMLSLPDLSYRNLADYFVKVISVGLPANFSKNISDRISKDSISEVNFNNKQFDVVSINVYKRDARYDSLVFKPQKFIFDLSLFPVKNLLPPLLDGANQSWSTILQMVKFKDYETLSNKKDATLSSLTLDDKYNFLSLEQRSELVENHLKSQMFDLYTRLLLGMRIDEETFSSVDYSKINVQDKTVTSLILSYLKTIRRKNIPQQPIADLLVNPLVDQETKDIIRLLSYGNIIFQADFVKKRILEPKMFDRVFHIPVDIRNFELDVELTNSTVSGKSMFKSNIVQNQLITKGKSVYLAKENRNEASFEDIFVVVESNLRNT